MVDLAVGPSSKNQIFRNATSKTRLVSIATIALTVALTVLASGVLTASILTAPAAILAASATSTGAGIHARATGRRG